MDDITNRAALGAGSGHMAYRGLRGWLEQVEKMGELKKVDGAHWDVEMGSLTQMLTETSRGTAPAILFDKVPGLSRRLPHAVRAALLDQAHRADARPAARLRPPGRHREKVFRAHAGDDAAAAALRQRRPDSRERDRGRRRRRLEIPGAAPPRAGHGALHRHRRLRDDARTPTPAGSISAPIAARSMTARRSAARSPRASTAASIATRISSAASR